MDIGGSLVGTSSRAGKEKCLFERLFNCQKYFGLADKVNSGIFAGMTCIFEAQFRAVKATTLKG